jgi:Xaa-Pro aminopeptidase
MIRPQLQEFMRRMEKNSVAIIPSAQEMYRSHDANFPFRQDANFYYLTGFNEPEAIAVIAPDHPEHKYTLFVRPRDPERETWDGARAGVEGAKDIYGADAAFPVEEFPSKVQEIINNASALYYAFGFNAALDRLIIETMHRMRIYGRKNIYAPDRIISPGIILHELRLIKTTDEIALMQKAADIAAEAHIEAMKAVRPGMYEYEIEALMNYIFRKRGGSGWSFPPIVAGGANATVLHYTTNDAQLKDGDLLLLDAGADYQFYASDITRTFPVNGKFTAAQRDVYEIVLDVELKSIEAARVGVTMDELKQNAIRMLTEGMLKLGLLQGEADKLIEEKKYEKYFMHGLGHFLGIDVHDVGRYHTDGNSRALEAGMVITIEPGLYIPANDADAPEKYRGIGVRIEDDVLITEDGNRVLTNKVPKMIEEIENLMKK